MDIVLYTELERRRTAWAARSVYYPAVDVSSLPSTRRFMTQVKPLLTETGIHTVLTRKTMQGTYYISEKILQVFEDRKQTRTGSLYNGRLEHKNTKIVFGTAFVIHLRM